MQMVFQDPYSSLDPRFTIFSILEEAMYLERGRYKNFSQQKERLADLLARYLMKTM
jgi:ABC-type microcin C transport system duplicated ATPase subunit YejF